MKATERNTELILLINFLLTTLLLLTKTKINAHMNLLSEQSYLLSIAKVEKDSSDILLFFSV